MDVELEVSPEFISTAVRCVEDAIGDDIKEDIQSHQLRTQNSTPFRIWDLLNTNLCKYLKAPNCMTCSSKRGPWEMVIINERETGNIYTFMREKRYKELHEGIRKRKRMHYIDALVRHFNPDLLSPVGQTTFDNIQFQDEDNLSAIVQRLLTNLLLEGAVIKHHVLVLFESSRFELTGIRAAMIDSNLDVVAEQDWTSYISVKESVVMEHVKNPMAPANNPTRGLKLTAKATARKKADIAHKQKESQETN